MKYLIFLLSSLFYYALANANSIDTLKTPSTITDVNVFFNGAQVSRKADINVQQGKYMLALNGLPSGLSPQSIQVKNIEGCTILAVKHKLDYTTGTNNDFETIEDEIEAKTIAIQELKNTIEVLVLEENLLLDNTNLVGKENGTSVTEIKEAANFYRQRLNEIRAEKLQLRLQQKEISNQIQELRIDMNKYNNGKLQVYSQALIAIEAEKPIKGQLEISYYIASAGWEPLYDFRVNSTASPLRIVYNANVYQTTGEDWENVNITLSTNNPALEGKKPELGSWYVDKQSTKPIDKRNQIIDNGTTYTSGASSIEGRVVDEDGEPLIGVNVILKGTNTGTITDFDGFYSIKPVTPGNYNLSFSYIGYLVKIIDNINVDSNTKRSVNTTLQEDAVSLNEIVIIEYSEPFFGDDGMHSTTYTERDKGNDLNIKGSRGNSSKFFIDGVKVGGSSGRQTTNYLSATETDNVVNLEYAIEIPYTILSDGLDYSLKIKEVELPVEYVYYAVPKLDNNAFLTAEITDWTELNLLSGNSSIYYKGTFIGESVINTQLTNDTLNVPLGRDRNIIVERMGNKTLCEKRFVGNSIKETVAWDITTKNNTKSTVKLIVEDQFPLAENDKIDIELLEQSGAKINKKTGALTWELYLEPDKKTKLQNNYSIKYPKYMQLNTD